MITPKEKHVQNQALSTKRNKFFRLLQSSNNESQYCVQVKDDLKSIKEKLNHLVNERKSSLQVQSKDLNVPSEDNKKKDDLTLKKLKRKLNRKVVKFDEIVFGFNETLKLLNSKLVSMVWIDTNVSVNVVNVIHKICTINKVWCFDIDLQEFTKMFNLSTLMVLSFKHDVAEDNSIFKEIYDFMMKFTSKQSCDNKNDTNVETKKAADTDSNNVTNEKIDFYFSKSVDSYKSILKKRFDTQDDLDNVFIDNASFVSLAKTQFHFPDYERNKAKINVNIKLVCDNSNEKCSISKKLMEDLFEFDKIETEQEKQLKFNPPKIVKGQINMNQAKVKKRKQKSDNSNKKKSLKKS